MPVVLESIYSVEMDLPPSLRQFGRDIAGKYSRALFVAPYYVPKIVKGKFFYVDPKKYVPAGGEKGPWEPKQFIIQFNPEEITDNKRQVWREIPVPGTNVPLLQWSYGKARELSLSLLFSEVEQEQGLMNRIVGNLPPEVMDTLNIAGGALTSTLGVISMVKGTTSWDVTKGCIEHLKELRRLATPAASVFSPANQNPFGIPYTGYEPASSIITGERVRIDENGDEVKTQIPTFRTFPPPLMLFVYGFHIRMFCVMTQCSIRYLKMDRKLTPLIALADITLVEYPVYYDEHKQMFAPAGKSVSPAAVPPSEIYKQETVSPVKSQT